MLILSVAIFVGGCGASSDVRGRIERAVAAGCEGRDACRVDLGEVVPFDWQTMYVFPPGTDRDAIRAVTGADVQAFDTVEERIVFTRGRAIVHDEAQLPDYESSRVVNLAFAPNDAARRYFSLRREAATLGVRVQKDAGRTFYLLSGSP